MKHKLIKNYFQMKKTITFFSILILSGSAIYSQCTSGATSYDLTVSSYFSIGTSGPSFNMGIICSGGVLVDSANCCTRMVHVESGGAYVAGPGAYGLVYIKNGGIFDAQGNNNFFDVYYESGAMIYNYSGTMTLCSSVSFPSGGCASTGISVQEKVSEVNTYPNPSTGKFTILTQNEMFAPNNLQCLEIYNSYGEKIYQSETSELNNLSIDISSQPNGIYFLKTTSGQKQIEVKFVKE